MNIEYIESFLETAKLKSIAKSSEKLNMTHPALSKQIRSVENYFGASLFKRSSAGVELTDAGEALLRRLAPLYNELLAVRAEISNMHGVRKIRLGTLASLAAYYMPEIVFALGERNIEAEIVVSHSSHELYDMLNSGAVDAAVCERLPVHASVWNADLFEERYYAALYANHRLSGNKEISVTEVATEPLIVHPHPCRIRQLFTRLIEREGAKPEIKTEVNFGEFILGYVATGAGITFIPEIVANHIQNPNLHVIPVQDSEAKRTIALISLTDDLGKRLLPYFKKR